MTVARTIYLSAAASLLLAPTATAQLASPAPSNKYPYVAYVTIPHKCTATLIDPSWLLTNAHCIHSWTYDDGPAVAPRTPSNARKPVAIRRLVPDPADDLPSIRRLVPHPQWNTGRQTSPNPLVNYLHDIALIQLWEPITDRRPIRIGPAPAPGAPLTVVEYTSTLRPLLFSDEMPFGPTVHHVQRHRPRYAAPDPILFVTGLNPGGIIRGAAIIEENPAQSTHLVGIAIHDISHGETPTLKLSPYRDWIRNTIQTFTEFEKPPDTPEDHSPSP